LTDDGWAISGVDALDESPIVLDGWLGGVPRWTSVVAVVAGWVGSTVAEGRVWTVGIGSGARVRGTRVEDGARDRAFDVDLDGWYPGLGVRDGTLWIAGGEEVVRLRVDLP
jgi:hypothetical protein